MPEIVARPLLTTASVAIRDIACLGTCRHAGAEECASTTHLVFPYRGVFVRHLGHDRAVGDANQVLLFNPSEGYRVSHPVPGGDASLDVALSEPLLRELAPATLVRPGAAFAFTRQHLRIEPRAQALAAWLRHALARNTTEPLEAEGVVVDLTRLALSPADTRARTTPVRRTTVVDRVKVLLSGDPARRWTLAEIGAAVGLSPVYLTQLFTQVEGVPLYRYQLRLRLARALDVLGDYDDLTSLALDLGFSSHSHFTTTFRRAYGRTPVDFRTSVRRSRRPIARS